MAQVSIIIVNWNAQHYLERCLPTVFAQDFTDFEVILIDNGSTDGSVAYVQTHFPQVRVIQNQQNCGFAPANNQGIRASTAEFVALLNNDTTIDPRWLRALVQAMQSDPTVGMCAAKMLLAERPGIIDAAGIALDRAGIAWNVAGGQVDGAVGTEQMREPFGACGGAALYRRAMLDEIGLLDEEFFCYLEDVDLAWRAQWAGWRCLYAPQATVLHLHSATSNRIPHFKSRLLGRNKIWLICKNYPLPQLIWYLPIIALYELLSLGYALRQRRLGSALAGRWAALGKIPLMLTRRRTRVKRISSKAMLEKLHPIELPWQIVRRYVHLPTPARKLTHD
ncbi:MAG: glycosyltransferase family 2 protein [Caldilineaceae bacterium]